MFHGIAFVLYLAASLTLLIEVNHRRRDYGYEYQPYFAASVRFLHRYFERPVIVGRCSFQIIGLVLAGLYLLSTIFALRSYRGL